MQKSYSFVVVPVLGMLAILGLAYGLDNWIDTLRQLAQQNFAGALSWLVPAYIGDLILVGLMLAWLWFIHYKGHKGLILALIYAAAGLGLLFYNVLAIAVAPSVPLPMQLAIVPKSLSAFASAFIAIIGIQKLILRQAAL